MKRSVPILAAAALLQATPAFAHPGHVEAGFAAGLAHPITGVDHLLAMVLVGLWGGIAFPRRRWACPAAFVGFMLAGFAFGAAGGALPIAEMLILSSVGALGIALLFDLRAPLRVAAPIVAAFAIGHGFAHGAELPATGSAQGFVAGFVIATAALHALGLGLARQAQRMHARRATRAVGAAAVITAALMWAT